MRVPRSFLEGFIMFLLLIPIAIYYLIKWIVKGIAVLIIAIKQE
jgi:hypothetical protein